MNSRFTMPQIREVDADEAPDAIRDARPFPIDMGPAIQLSTRDAVLRVIEDRDGGTTVRRWEVSVYAKSNAFEEDRTIHFTAHTEVREGDEARRIGEAFALEVIAVIATAIEEASDD